MTLLVEKNLLNRWQKEIVVTGIEKDFWGIALFSLNKTLLFANAPIKKLTENFSHQKLINPSFEKLCELPQNGSSIVFEGFLTIGDYSHNNVSLPAIVFRKSDELLILTGYDYDNLQQQNNTLHQLNREINNLQRQIIHEKRNLENTLYQLDERNQELQKINRQKDKLFSVIAHDLKSPFSGLLGFTEILKENLHELPVHELNEYACHVHLSAKNTYSLIETLLEWASLQREAVQINRVKTNINQLLKEVLELVNEQASGKELSIRIEIPDALEWAVDRNMLTSIFRNLLTNAIKFSFPNNDILVSVKQLQNELQFSVTDKGVGMPDEMIKNLFVNEFNDSTRGTADEKGSGLGLAICKDFVQMHGGKIWAESEVGMGSTITFTLPYPD